MTLAGYWLGRLVPQDQLGRYLHLIIGGIIFLSILPPIVHAVRERRRGAPVSGDTEPERPLVASEAPGARE
jgi:membrane-associated protein